MYVCICNGITDRDIKRAVQRGAETLGCLQAELSVSTCCGQCEDRAVECLQRALTEELACVLAPA